MTFRKTIFWLHLLAGTIAGAVIAVICFTGATLAFESEITCWAERDARTVTVPASPASRLGVRELLAKVREVEPEARPSAIAVSADPSAAIAFTLGRDQSIYANPYTGELRRPASTKARDILRVLNDCHRALALGGEKRVVGRVINGSCNLAFCFLTITGLYLWWPRSWSRKGLRAISLFNRKATGKARDFNWHNVIGLWSAPVLIVLTLTAIPISFRWGTNLIYRLTGETPPALPAPTAAGPGLSMTMPKPPVSPARLDYDALLETVKKAAPDWELLTIRLGNTADAGASRPATPPVTITLKQPGQWPRTAVTTFSLDPSTGDVLKREGYADQSAARRIRSWTRYLHTGQALGLVGQLVAFFACVGALVLVYTGFALAIRRFKGRTHLRAP
ncbi:MAG: PepSY-associated helix domain protein [Verrucomicrobia bacterium]|nr:PepSY-associated helix domain protein [Verrucomicrobiota bacterium]